MFILITLLCLHSAHSFLPSKRTTRIMERGHRELSDLHLHSPIHTRWRDHEYEDECTLAYTNLKLKDTINPIQFHELIQMVWYLKSLFHLKPFNTNCMFENTY